MKEQQTEWRSGGVVVRGSSPAGWAVSTPHPGEEDRVHIVPVSVYPDPQALAEFIDSQQPQQPQPRYYVDPDRNSSAIAGVRDRMGGGVAHVTTYTLDLDARIIAQHLADWLNQQEADREA